MQLKVDVCPSEILSLTNKVILNPKDIANLNQAKHVRITTGPSENQQYIFSVEPNDKMLAGHAGFSESQREWIDVELNQDVVVYVHNPDSSKVVSSVNLVIEFFSKQIVTQDNYDTDQLAKEFLQ